MGRWRALAVLGTAQFLMVLDSAVMNVSISQLVEDFDTEVTVIQGVITMYALVMASFMMVGGKLGDRYGRRRVFSVGMAVYGVGSLITAISPTVGVLLLGWSILEGLGAAMVLPALAALVGGNYEGRDRGLAYGVIGGLAGAGIAVGPILGGWVTTNLTWRLVFVGEAVIVVVVLLLVGWISEAPRPERVPKIDGVGALLSALGLGAAVFSVLMASSWGWILPKDSPVEPLGFSLTPFLFAAGLALLYAFAWWERRREREGRDPLVHLGLFQIAPLKAGLLTLTSQNVILLGLFFALPLYLQVTQGLDAFETGLRLLPVSITMLVASLGGASLNQFAPPRRIVRAGFVVLLVACLALIGTIEPELDDTAFAVTMAVLGLGMGLLASQLGNVVQSAVGEKDRSEVGGLQYTAQNVGSAMGTALVGAILLSALTVTVANNVNRNEAVSAAVKDAIGMGIEAQGGVEFVPADDVADALDEAGVPPDETAALVDDYSEAQLEALKLALLAVAGLVLVGLAFTRNLPDTRREDDEPDVAVRVPDETVPLE